MKALGTIIILSTLSIPAQGQVGMRQGILIAGQTLHEGTRENSPVPTGHWLDELGVSAEQRTRIQEIRNKKHLDAEKYLEELNGLHVELKRHMAGEDPNELAREVHKRMQEVKRELDTVYFESMLSIRELLTPQQRARFVESMRLRGRLGIEAK